MHVIEYGSRKRGDADSTSDRDVLIIYEDKIQLRRILSQYEGHVYNVSAVSNAAARYSISKGSLFFKHIAEEGVLISGDVERCAALLDGWTAARSYDSEIDSSLGILELLSFVPKTERGITAGIDVVANSLRSILIRRLATVGVYVLDWQKIVKESCRMGFLRPKDGGLLLEARRIKNLYRQRRSCAVEMSTLEDLADCVGLPSGRQFSLRFATRAEGRKLPERCADGSYRQLRALEFLCSHYPDDSSLRKIENLVRRPSYFCGRKSTLFG